MCWERGYIYNIKKRKEGGKKGVKKEAGKRKRVNVCDRKTHKSLSLKTDDYVFTRIKPHRNLSYCIIPHTHNSSFMQLWSSHDWLPNFHTRCFSMPASTSTLSSASAPTAERPPPRLRRFGGFSIPNHIVMHWASRINGELLDGKDVYLVWKSILNRFQPRGINFLEIGEGGVDWMVITQYTSFRGYRGMHSS